MPERERRLHLGAAQIERAVLEPQALVHRLPLLERERRRLCVSQHLELGDVQLHLAGRDVRVDVLGLAARDLPGDRDHVL